MSVSKVDMLWLDLQGYELPVLKASPNVLKTVNVICLEVEFVEAYQGQALYDEIKVWLEQNNFELYAANFKKPKVSANDHECWFGDALFVKRVSTGVQKIGVDTK